MPPGEFPHLHADHSLDVALDRMGALHLDLLPVVSRANIHELLGVVEARRCVGGVRTGQKEGKLESTAATAAESTTRETATAAEAGASGTARS